MATFKHISSKNADYGAAEQYLTFEHDEFTMKPTLDENGRLMLREDYRIATLNCGDEDFAVACMRSNLRYGKNQKREDVKSHHYIISFDPRDAVDNGLTVDRAQALGEEFCRKQFPGHQAIVCTHPDGHNHSGNIHVHIVINEEKLVTYPRTDSQFVTEDMRKTVESLVLALDGAAADVSCVIDNSKVTDHHAILPTMQGAKCNKAKLSETKQKILSLIIWKLVQAVQPPFIYEDVLVTVCCQGRNFTAKYKDVLQSGYTAKPVPLVEPEKNKDVSLPNDLEQGMVIPVVRAEKKQGFTSPPKVYTEDTLLSAMETAGNKEFEKDTEKKGLGTPATRAAILEKLVSSGYVQRKGKQMIPTEDGVAAIRNIPDYLKSASMTAEWENDLLRMERGEIKPYDFIPMVYPRQTA